MITPVQEKRLQKNADRMVQLSALFVRHDRFLDLEERVNSLARQRRAELAAGLVKRRKGLSVIGESGAGKTEALKKIRLNFVGLRTDAPDNRIGEFVSVETPSPATLKWTGIATLKSLNFDIGGKPGAPEIWALVRHHLAMHRVLFLHFDEAQDFILNQSGREANSVINTIKSLTQCERWPVSVILSGNTVLADILDSDFQLGRRVPPVHFENLSSAVDTSDVADILGQYLAAADLRFDVEYGIEEFIPRLIAAASGQLGLVFEFILEAISLAFDAQRSLLNLSDFQQVYRDRTGSINGANPFIAEDYLGINARAVLDGKLTKQVGPKKSWVVS